MKLEAGMNVYCNPRFGDGWMKFTIARVTEKQAIVQEKNNIGNVYETRFDREQPDNQGFYAKGDKGGYGSYIYYPETPEIIEKYHRSVLERKFAKLKAKDLTTEQLENILKAAN